VSRWIGPSEKPKFFQKDTTIESPSTTPFFMDALWPDLWPGKDEIPPTDLFAGNELQSCSRGDETVRLEA
jgi:hypothetical protein